MRSWLIILLLVVLLSPASADQPIFNEMPRWSGGYGVQIIQSYRLAEELEQSKAPFETAYHYSKVEGVYTWQRWVRLTAKLRLLYQRTINQRVSDDAGLTDLRLSVPLKSYFNLDGRSGSYTLAPELSLPLTDQNHGQLLIGIRRYGLSAGYKTEWYFYHFGVRVSVRKQEQRPDLQYTANLSTGLNGFFIGFAGHLKAEAHYNDMGGGHHIVRAGPTLDGQITGVWHWQLKWHRAVFETHGAFGVLKDQFITAGFAFVQ